MDNAMQRRRFLQVGAAATAAAAASAPASSQDTAAPSKGKGRFKLKYAPHFGMFKHHAGNDPIAQLQFMADEGFEALEDNGMRNRDVALQEKIAKEMERLGMEMGVFVASASKFGKVTFASDDPTDRQWIVDGMKKSVEVAKRVNARWCTVVPGDYSNRLELDYQMANVIDNLRAAAEVCEPHGLIMVLEPLNWWANHPGVFLTKMAQAYAICRAVNSPSVKILDDLYHQQITEGNLIPNMDRSWDEIAYFQVGDNPGRKEPTTGEINYRNVFRHIHQRGFTGLLGMEHGLSQGGQEGERKLIDAYAWCDDF